MKVQAPLRPGDNPLDLIKYGADEFYVGFMDPYWDRHYGMYGDDLNRMYGFGTFSNYANINEIIELRKTIDCNTRLFVTLNSHSYSTEETDYILRQCDMLEKTGIDGLVLGDPALIKIACESGYKVVVSTVAGVYCHELINWYEDLGVMRIILPRDLTLDEIRSMTFCSHVEFEAFIMHNGCTYSDSSCCLSHGLRSNPLCGRLHHSSKQYLTKDVHKIEEIQQNSVLFDGSFHKHTCGLCSIHSLREAGVEALKIVGRADQAEQNMEACRLVKTAIRLSEKCKTEEEYKRSIRPLFYSEQYCRDGLSCYYPESKFT